MNRYVILAGVGIVIVATGLVFFLRPGASSPAGQGGTTPVLFPGDSGPPALSRQARSKEAVQSTFRNEIAPYNDDNVKLYKTAIEGDYALQLWRGDNTGGQALLTYNVGTGQWAVLTGGGGAWSVDGLVDAGVPRDIATALLAEMP